MTFSNIEIGMYFYYRGQKFMKIPDCYNVEGFLCNSFRVTDRELEHFQQDAVIEMKQ